MTPIRRGADLVRRRPRATTYALAFLVHLLVAPFLIHDWDGYVFITTAEDFLRGQSPYETVERESSYIYIGDGVPVVNSWYAYPPVSLLLFAPFYGVFTFLLGHAPWVERLGVKIPIVLGDLALAYAAYLLVRASVDDPERAERRARLAERAILFNPFLVFISAAWGMFDAWMMALLVGAIWALAVRRFALGGALLALAVLVKPFPALALPLIAFYAWRQGAARGLARWAAGGAATAAVVCLPFLLLSPGGFMQQVVFNHMGRPPQGFTLMGVPLAFGWING
ncbi:MAG TPA: glycosyltransferase 87 family protein, partial [Candidatus Thermoplasmatota archaeon]|nr:glycosyltransferase 87 family protein [Candidatus Thermoplasmatota archaeon]